MISLSTNSCYLRQSKDFRRAAKRAATHERQRTSTIVLCSSSLLAPEDGRKEEQTRSSDGQAGKPQLRLPFAVPSPPSQLRTSEMTAQRADRRGGSANKRIVPRVQNPKVLACTTPPWEAPPYEAHEHVHQRRRSSHLPGRKPLLSSPVYG